MVRNSLPRTIINLGLRGMRLPLTAAEFVTGHTERSWPPATAFEALESGVKRVVGSFIKDGELVREGTLQSLKVQELTEAERLQLNADQIRGAAEDHLEQELESAQHQREVLEHETALRQEQVALEASEKERAVEQQSYRRQKAADDAIRARGRIVTAQERRAERTRIAEESAALAERRHSVEAKKHVKDLEGDLQAKKAERKA